MSQKVDIVDLFDSLQSGLEQSLKSYRKLINHPGTKGDATEGSWIRMLQDYLPSRYKVSSAFVVDSKGSISDQMDIVIYDHQYSPFLFNKEGVFYVPAESVYAVFEVKQEINVGYVKYAGDKIKSVRSLVRTSAKITHAGGIFEPRSPYNIIGGILTTSSTWKYDDDKPFGKPFQNAIKGLNDIQRIDIGCALSVGSFVVEYDSELSVLIETKGGKSALLFFFLKLLSKLQRLGSALAIDIDAYAKWVK